MPELARGYFPSVVEITQYNDKYKQMKNKKN